MRELSGPELARLGGGAEAAARPLLLDVREPWECALASIRIDGLDALEIPMASVPAQLGELDPSRPVVFVPEELAQRLREARRRKKSGERR